MSHVMFGGLTHRPAVELGERLAEITPAALQRVFLCDSGSVSIEVAIKMALQYYRARGLTGRTRLLTVRGGYHGDTLGAMSVGARDVFSRPFEGLLFDTTYLPHDDPEAIESFFREHGHEVPISTIHRVLVRRGINRLRDIAPDGEDLCDR